MSSILYHSMNPSKLTYAFIFCFLFSCTKPQEIVFKENNLEQYRPEYHFSPAKGWMNDPNGMIYIDGEYHLFFQHYPDSTVWGPMHWGHAKSSNLLDWEELPIAIYPDSLGYIFSGSAVYDQENSSGLGTPENPPLVAIFTYHHMDGERSGKTDFQCQGIAFSLDKGKTWEKFSGNPVLPNQGIKDFRDPKVRKIKNSDGKDVWIMTLAAWNQVQFYQSENLIEWKLAGEFGKEVGAHGGVWECPDLIPMKAPNGQTKWILLVSINPGGPQKGSATQYFIGNFKDGHYSPDDTMIRWLDYGPDNYAGVTWSNLPESQERNLFIGWMSNWLYAQVVPTQSWRSAMTIPRELSLIDIDGTLLVKSAPAREITDQRKETFEVSGNVSKLPGTAFELTAEVENDFSLVFRNELGENVSITREMGLITIDRSRSGKSDFHRDFAAVHSAPMSWEVNSIRIFMDASSIELFVNEGDIVMTSLLFPSTPYKTLELISGVKNAELHRLKK